MSYTSFTAEQLAQEARADRQQSEVLHNWLLAERERNCQHSNCRVFTNGRRSSRPCRDFAVMLEYPLDELSIRRHACAFASRPAPRRAA